MQGGANSWHLYGGKYKEKKSNLKQMEERCSSASFGEYYIANINGMDNSPINHWTFGVEIHLIIHSSFHQGVFGQMHDFSFVGTAWKRLFVHQHGCVPVQETTPTKACLNVFGVRELRHTSKTVSNVFAEQFNLHIIFCLPSCRCVSLAILPLVCTRMWHDSWLKFWHAIQCCALATQC